jgi:GNAT superfamily N-acetyltransferase
VTARLHGETRDADGDSGYRIREAMLADVEVAAEVLADAFIGYPWTTWTVDARDHTARMRRLYRAVLEQLVLPFGAAWVAEENSPTHGRLIGVAGWLTPASVPTPKVQQALALLEEDARGNRWQHHLRAEAQLESLRPDTPHWLLGAVGVHLRHRRRGIGARLLSPGLDAASAAGADAHLETSSPGNVAVYRRLGFTVIATTQIHGGGPMVWLMRRFPG